MEDGEVESGTGCGQMEVSGKRRGRRCSSECVVRDEEFILYRMVRGDRGIVYRCHRVKKENKSQEEIDEDKWFRTKDTEDEDVFLGSLCSVGDGEDKGCGPRRYMRMGSRRNRDRKYPAGSPPEASHFFCSPSRRSRVYPGDILTSITRHREHIDKASGKRRLLSVRCVRSRNADAIDKCQRSMMVSDSEE